MLNCDFLGKKQLVPPIPAKMLFKAGTEEIMKFPIGVITNSVGEVLVGDTGNHVVRVYSSEGKYLRDIGKEVRFKRSHSFRQKKKYWFFYMTRLINFFNNIEKGNNSVFNYKIEYKKPSYSLLQS